MKMKGLPTIPLTKKTEKELKSASDTCPTRIAWIGT
jgi:hypothetical protein